MKKILVFLILFFNITIAFSQTKNHGNDDHVLQKPVIYLNYDAAGNQVQRFYCSHEGSCQIPEPPTSILEEGSEETEETRTVEQHEIADSFSIYPNPTKGPLLIKWEQAVKDQIQAIKIIGYHTPYNRPIVFDENDLSAEIDLSNEMSSIYIVQFFLADGQIISKKIIKD